MIAERVRQAADRWLASMSSRVRGPRVHGLQHAGVTVADFEAAVSWYHDMFGFLLVSELVLDAEQTSGLADLYGVSDVTVRLGFLRSQSGMVLEIFQFTPASPAQPTVWIRPGYTHVALAVTDVPALATRLKDKGVRFVTDVQFSAGAHWAFLRDPDGNLVELIDLHANRLPLQWLGGVVGRVLKRGRFAGYYR